MTDVTDEDIGKPILTVEGNEIGTLAGINGPTLHIRLAEDIDDALRSDMKIAETTAFEEAGETLAGAPLAAIADITDEAIHFWPAYATEAAHESVSYEEIPGADSNVELEES